MNIILCLLNCMIYLWFKNMKINKIYKKQKKYMRQKNILLTIKKLLKKAKKIPYCIKNH